MMTTPLVKGLRALRQRTSSPVRPPPQCRLATKGYRSFGTDRLMTSFHERSRLAALFLLLAAPVAAIAADLLDHVPGDCAALIVIRDPNQASQRIERFRARVTGDKPDQA